MESRPAGPKPAAGVTELLPRPEGPEVDRRVAGAPAAEEALDRLRPFFPAMYQPWTRDAPLPGGDIENGDVAMLIDRLARSYPALDRNWLGRLARRHGTRVRNLLGDARTTASAPTLPPAPERFSTTTGWPSSSCILG